MEDDWDLQAIVRSYTATISATATTTTSTTATTTTTSGTGVISSGGAYMTDLTCSSLNPSMSILRRQQEEDDETRKSCSQVVELNELYKPFFADSSLSSPVSPLSIQRQAINPLQHQLKQSFTIKTTHSANSSTRAKRRKNQMKKVFQVPAEGLASDTWSWRKYGQKPIKGSPYPRGYYRCSSSKGCLARKQVERNRTDPTMFIITYTAEHNHPVPTHRNSLAGTTRHQKQPSSPLSPSLPVDSPNDHNPTTTTKTHSSNEICSLNGVMKLETRSELDGDQDGGDEDGEDEEHGFSDMAMSDDFFDGLDEIAGPAMTADFFTDNVPASFVIPWMANNAAAAAGSS